MLEVKCGLFAKVEPKLTHDKLNKDNKILFNSELIGNLILLAVFLKPGKEEF